MFNVQSDELAEPAVCTRGDAGGVEAQVGAGGARAAAFSAR